MKIAVEGMDGVGKSTIAKMICDKYNFKYIEKPMKELFHTDLMDGKEVLNHVSGNVYDLDTNILKAWFFGLGNLYTFDKYRDEDLVIDRHFASNYFWNGNDESDIIFKTMLELIGTPDLTILLYASPKTRLQRLYIRHPNDYDLTDEEKHVNGYDKMVGFFESFDIPYILIDTENRSIEEIFSEVDSLIIEYLKAYEPKKLLRK